MTISAYTGLPGHGKSYGVVENVIAEALKKGRNVFTNIPMNRDVCLNRFNNEVNPFDIQDIIDNPNWWDDIFIAGSIIVLDELWRLWPSGLNAKNVRESDKSFLAEHRHLVGECGNSTEIVFVTQDLSQIASFARSLVETTYRVTKQSRLGADNRFRLDIYFGPVTGVSPPKSKRDKEIHGKFKKSTYELYKSHTKSETGLAGDESRIDNRFSLFSGKLFYIISVIIFSLAYFVYTGSAEVSAYFGRSKPVETKPIGSNTPTPKNIQVKEPVFRFLSDADQIFIIFNNGTWPDIEYQYRVVFDDYSSDFSYSDFQLLGYGLTPINKCMVKIKGPDFNGFAMCKRGDDKENWFEKAVSTEDSIALN